MDSIKLDDLLESFQKTAPIGSDIFDYELNNCAHFASRIWRDLGIVESEALGDFLVENIVKDPNLIHIASRKAGSIAVVAATIFGPDAFRGHIEKVVFSQMNIPRANALRERRLAEGEENSFDFSQYGVSLGFDERHLEGSACYEAEYDVDLILVGTPLIFVEPAPEAPAGCSSFLLHTTTLLDEFGQLVEGQEFFKKEVIRFDDAIPQHQTLTELRGTVITEGTFELQAIIRAYYDARIYSDPVEGESHEMHVINSIGVFVADFFNLLGHTTTETEMVMISAGLMMSDPNIAATLRMTANETISATMTDAELVNWLVEQTAKTVNMTVVGNN